MKNIIIIFIFVQHVCGLLDLVGTVLTDAEELLVEQLNALAQELSGSCSVDLIQQNESYVSLFIYTQASPNGTEVALTDANKLTTVSPFNLQLKTMFYSHGWTDCYDGESATAFKDTLLKVANFNFISVNWDNCSSYVNYLSATRCVPVVGQQIGQFIETVAKTYNYSLNDIIAVGHSLGAHVTGFIGKSLNGSLGVILGLDPAGFLYYEDVPAGRLDKTDAQFVQIIHTNAQLIGVSYSLGDSDFWPNGGYTQSNCSSVDNVCSHQIVWKYYNESLTDNAFYARQCDSYDDYQNGLCSQNSTALMGGLEIDTSTNGNYYLNTNDESPYGLGDV